MAFERVRFTCFRNIVDEEISTSADRVFLVGENGQGKTNFLEALYYLSFGTSFRGTVDSGLVNQNDSSFSLRGEIHTGVKGLPNEEIRISWDTKLKEIRLSNKIIHDRKELLEKNPSIVFCHEDFSFAAGEPARRRFFFDQTASLVSTNYIDLLREYKRILKQRNVSLRERRYEIIPPIDFQLARTGLSIMLARDQLRSALDSRFAQRFEAVARLGYDINIEYRPSWSSSSSLDDILALLEKKRVDDVSAGTSLTGPHRDRWYFSVKQRDFSDRASTGQLRLLSLTLRLMQAEYFTETTGRLPVLLIDDVLLEIDPNKRKRFLSLIPENGQAFFTFLPGENWKDYQTLSTLVYEVSGGRFKN